MNAEEIKDRLSCFRPDIDDPADELFAPALAAAEKDSDLAGWFEEQKEFDTALRGHLKTADLPDGLLAHLKANAQSPAFDSAEAEETEGAAQVATAAQAQSSPVRPANIIFASFWTRIAAAAAALVVGLLVVNSFNSSADAVEAFRGDMASIATEGFDLDHKSGNLATVRQWLASEKAPIYDECPPCIGKMKGVGCRKFTWNDHTVSVVCFKKDTGNVVHMFVVERAALPGMDDAEGKVAVKQQLGLETGGWTDGKNVYLLVGSKSGVPVSDLL